MKNYSIVVLQKQYHGKTYSKNTFKKLIKRETYSIRRSIQKISISIEYSDNRI